MSAKTYSAAAFLLFFSFHSLAEGLKDTIYNPIGDTMIVRRSWGQKVRSEKHYVKNELVYTRRFTYGKEWYGYVTKNVKTKQDNLAPFKNFWNNGKLRMIGSTLNGKLTGSFLTFYPNGKPQCTCNYKEGKRDGKQVFRYDNGQLGHEVIYKEGVPWSIEKNFNKDGSPGKDGTLKDGTGSFFIYDKQEKAKRIEHYQGGTLIRKEKIKT